MLPMQNKIATSMPNPRRPLMKTEAIKALGTATRAWRTSSLMWIAPSAPGSGYLACIISRRPLGWHTKESKHSGDQPDKEREARAVISQSEVLGEDLGCGCMGPKIDHRNQNDNEADAVG